MIKVLHIPNYYPPHTGGIEDVCYNVVRILNARNDIQQRIFCFHDRAETLTDTYEGIKVTRVGVWRKIASQSVAFSYGRELRKVINDYMPDVVHFHAPNPLAAWFLLNNLPKTTKLIVHWHSDIVAQSIIYLFVKPIESHLLRRADIIVATSPNYIEESKPLQRFAEKVRVIQNIIDPDKFALTPQRQQQIEKIRLEYKNQPIVLFVGRHVTYKGLGYLIEASKNLSSDFALVIGGKGPLTKALKKSAKERSNIHFVGRIADEELAAYFYAADIFVFPSITKNEAFGVALAEAMYCETPAITFTINGSGVNWVNLSDKTGIEVPNSDAVALGGAIEHMLSEAELRTSMARQAKERVETLFVKDKIKDKINQLYDI